MNDVLAQVSVTLSDGSKWRYHQRWTAFDWDDARHLNHFRERFDQEVAHKLAKEGKFYGATIGQRETAIMPGSITGPPANWKLDGDWLDAELFPPDPMEILAKDVSRVLADKARRQQRAEWGALGTLVEIFAAREARASIAIDDDNPGQTLIECPGCGRGMSASKGCSFCKEESNQ